MRSAILILLFAVTSCACSRTKTVGADASGSTAAPVSAPVSPLSPPPAMDAGALVNTTPMDAGAPVGSGVPVVPKLAISPPADPSPYNWKLTTEGLPAISADGLHAVVVVDGSDGGRGYPTNELVFLTIASDRTEKRMPLLVADEFGAVSAESSEAEVEALARKIRARLGKANALLTKTPWVSLAYAREPGGVADIDVTLASARLFARDRAGATLLDRDVRPWMQVPVTIPGFAPCTFDADLTLTAVDLARSALVVVVRQTGSGDQCGEQSVAHALRMHR